jgi:hypothetical protein
MGNYKSKHTHRITDIANGTYVSVVGLESVLRGFAFDNAVIHACVNMSVNTQQTFVTAEPGHRSKIDIQKLIYNGEEVVNFKIVEFDER